MFTNDGLSSIIEEVDVLLAEIRELSASGPHFRIIHRFHRPGSECTPGEEIFAVYLVHRGREFSLPLSLALRILFDYLARHSRLPQSAAQIEAGIRGDRFYTQHAAAAMGKGKFTRSIPRSYVRVYIGRLRSALARAFRKADMSMDPRDVLLSEATVMNESGYRLKATIEWFHMETGHG
jgi:hypothetical protein